MRTLWRPQPTTPPGEIACNIILFSDRITKAFIIASQAKGNSSRTYRFRIKFKVKGKNMVKSYTYINLYQVKFNFDKPK